MKADTDSLLDEQIHEILEIQHTAQGRGQRRSEYEPEIIEKLIDLIKAEQLELLERVEKMGFQVVLSRHTTTNNSIIIPKLKAGFVITALEVSDRFGTLVHLSYYFNEKRRKVMLFRAGDFKPDQDVKSALRLDEE